MGAVCQKRLYRHLIFNSIHFVCLFFHLKTISFPLYTKFAAAAHTNPSIMSNHQPARPCCFYCEETKFANRAEALASLKSDEKAVTPHGSKPIKTETSMCHRLGPVTRNPFFNFLRHLRETTCSKSIIDLAKHAGQEWRKMSDELKCRFVMEAHRAPKRRRRNQSGMSFNSTLKSSTKMPALKKAKRLNMNHTTIGTSRVKKSRMAHSTVVIKKDLK